MAGVEEAEGQHVWSEHTTDDGHTYYHNTVTDETSWTKPEIELKNVPAGTVAREQGLRVATPTFKQQTQAALSQPKATRRGAKGKDR